MGLVEEAYIYTYTFMGKRGDMTQRFSSLRPNQKLYDFSSNH